MLEEAQPPEPLRLFVARKQIIASDIVLFDLRPRTKMELPPFTPGAHIEVNAPGGLWRKYSLLNGPDETQTWQIAIKREPNGGGGSLRMWERVGAGEVLEVRPPRNDFELKPSPAGYTLIAGGIGITPILAMAKALKAEGKPFRLYYLTRSPAATAFLDLLSGPEWQGKVVVHHDGGDPARAFDLWPVLEKPKGQVYCCGPRSLMDAVRDMTGHWSSGSVHFEAFTDPKRIDFIDRDFSVVLARSGRTIPVPIGTTILEALHAAGVRVPYSCQAGTCGSCQTALVSGDVEHRDLVLNEKERATSIMVCISRARSGDIVLDL
jgi:phthalate 4,5-dioxygenase reductase subunit